jgi:hypothetical protein
VPFAYTAGRLVTVHRYLGVATGLLSIGFGLFLAYQIGLVDGCLRQSAGHPRSARIHLRPRRIRPVAALATSRFIRILRVLEASQRAEE